LRPCFVAAYESLTLPAFLDQGGEQYPHFPTPLLQDLELQMPLVNLDVPQGQLAEKYMRESVFVQHRKDGAPPDDYLLKTELARVELQTEKHLLQIIQTFCKADRLEAALDAVLLLSQPASLVAASKIAGFFTLPALQERVDLLQQMREESGDPEAAAAKRQSKWAHLADDRYITSNGSGSAGAGFGGPANAAASLFGPGSADAFGSSRKSFGTPAGTQMSSTSARKKRKSVADASESAAAGFPGSDDVEPNAFDDELEYADVQVDSSPKRMRLDSEEVLEEDETPVQAPPKKGEPAETPETPALSPAH
jgi:chromosome transmission fidelity protein 4